MNVSISPVKVTGTPTPIGEHKGEPQNTSPGQNVSHSSEQLAAVVRELKHSVSMINARVSFSIDRGTNKVVIKVIDSDTNEVIRQIPPEELLRISANIKELLGVLLDKTV